MRLLKQLVLICVFISGLIVYADDDEFLFVRTYSVGQKFKYKLTATEITPEKSQVTVATSLHDVQLNDVGIPVEKVRWTTVSKDGADQKDQAESTPPLLVSLDPKFSLNVPNLDSVPEIMVGPLTDLLTFYVALSNRVGISQVRKTGESFANPEKHIGDWSRSQESLGQDCTMSTIELKNLNSHRVSYRSYFKPPSDSCLVMYKHEWETPVKDGTPNNFQIVKQDKKTGKWLAMWGLESFFVDSDISRATGQILKSTMSNDLNLKMKIGCDINLENCQAEFPLNIHRDLVLELQSQ